LYQLTPNQESHLEIDSHGYERTATYFAATSQLTDPATPNCHPVQTLAYPLFLGMIYKIFGHSYAWVVMMQLLLAVLCGLLIFYATQQIAGLIAAFFALFFWATDFGFLIYVQFLLTEMLLVTFLTAFMYQLILVWRTKDIRHVLSSGFLLGFSVVVKPAGIFFIIPLAGIFLLFLSAPFAQRMIKTGLLIAAFAAPIAGYMIHNKVRFGHFTIAPMANEILYRYFTAKVQAQIEGTNYEDILVQRQWCTTEDLLDDTGWESSRTFLHNALWQHPFVILKLWFSNVIKTWFGLFSTQWKVLLDSTIRGGDCSFFKMSGHSFMLRLYQYITCSSLWWLSIISLLEALCLLLKYCLVSLGLWQLWRDKKHFILSFCAIYFSYFTLVTGHDGCCRYRMMIEPLLIITSAIGMHTLLKLYLLKELWLLAKYQEPS
jgi:4-amino-4-deoxy-L-arabinose transferase-like glycosyltransferase